MRIAIDSNDLPAPQRVETWRGMLCDTYMGVDCRLPSDFRSVIEGHAVGNYTLTRITSTQNTVDRSISLIKRDGLELIFFGILLAGKAVTFQGGREAVLKRGTVVVSDTSRPFRTHIEDSADILWLSVPKKSIAERLRGIEDLVAISLIPGRPMETIVLDLMGGFDELLKLDLPAHEAERLMTNVLDVMSMTLTSAGLPPGKPQRPAKGLLQ